MKIIYLFLQLLKWCYHSLISLNELWLGWVAMQYYVKRMSLTLQKETATNNQKFINIIRMVKYSTDRKQNNNDFGTKGLT